MNTKNILIVVGIVLCVGLAIVIYLSFQVVNDTESAVTVSPVTPPQVKSEKQSIYGIDLPAGEKQVIRVYGKEAPPEKGKPSTPIPAAHIKTYELEKAELSTGVQPEQAPSIAPSESKSSSPSSSQSSTNVEQTEQKAYDNMSPTEEQVRDLQKKGIAIF